MGKIIIRYDTENKTITLDSRNIIEINPLQDEKIIQNILKSNISTGHTGIFAEVSKTDYHKNQLNII